MTEQTRTDASPKWSPVARVSSASDSAPGGSPGSLNAMGLACPPGQCDGHSSPCRRAGPGRPTSSSPRSDQRRAFTPAPPGRTRRPRPACRPSPAAAGRCGPAERAGDGGRRQQGELREGPHRVVQDGQIRPPVRDLAGGGHGGLVAGDRGRRAQHVVPVLVQRGGHRVLGSPAECVDVPGHEVPAVRHRERPGPRHLIAFPPAPHSGKRQRFEKSLSLINVGTGADQCRDCGGWPLRGGRLGMHDEQDSGGLPEQRQGRDMRDERGCR